MQAPPLTLPLPGETIWIRRERWRVERAFRDGDAIRLDVISPTRRRTFLAPFDIPLRAREGVPRLVRRQQALARAASLIARAEDPRLPLALLDADVDIVPHQLEPALAMLDGWSRLLVADEVGLGKTIQAGIAIAELLRRNAAPRVLVLVPAALRDQWHAELLGRFGIHALSADRKGLEVLARDDAFGASPWQRSGVWLASPDFLKQPHALQSLPRDLWDLVVVDEAHTMCGNSDRYAAGHLLASRARRLILLTATPHSGDETRFSRLIALGQLDASPGEMLVFRRTRADVGMPVTRHVRWHFVRLSLVESRALAELRAFERAVLHATGRNGEESARLLLAVFRKRALSTFAAFSRSVSRRLAWLEIARDAGPAWQQARLLFDTGEDETETGELSGLTAATGFDVGRERAWLRRLRQLADDAAGVEGKVARVVSLLERSSEPVVVFTEFRDSLEAIERRLRRGRALAVLHGGLSPSERRAQLRSFLGGPASVLLATDVAGQGLNLQSRGRWVISLELPWNPARLEQRIGRVDRIGQGRPAHFTLLVARHAAESGLLAHLSRRVLGAQKSFAAGCLQDVAPPETSIRDALLSESVDVGDAARGYVQVTCIMPGAVPLSRRWLRPAQLVARGLVRRRAFARRWRAPASDERPARCRRVRGAARTEAAADPSVLLCSLPMLTDTGELVERVVFAVRLQAGDIGASNPRQLADAVMHVVRIRIERRLSKTARRIAAARDRLTLRDTALLEKIAADARHRETQPGLFDLSAIRVREALANADDRLERVERVRAGSLLSQATLRLGDLEIGIVLPDLG